MSPPRRGRDGPSCPIRTARLSLFQSSFAFYHHSGATDTGEVGEEEEGVQNTNVLPVETLSSIGGLVGTSSGSTFFSSCTAFFLFAWYPCTDESEWWTSFRGKGVLYGLSSIFSVCPGRCGVVDCVYSSESWWVAWDLTMGGRVFSSSPSQIASTESRRESS